MSGPDDWLDPLPGFLSNYMAVSGSSQAELASLLNLAQTSVSRLITGKRSASVAHRLLIARRLRAPLSAVGLSDQLKPDVGEQIIRLAPTLVTLAGNSRYAGRSPETLSAIAELDREISGLRAAGLSQDAWARLASEVKLTHGLVLGDVAATSSLWRVTALTTAGLDLARSVGDATLLWKALMRHGNELRKAGNPPAGVRYLEASRNHAPSSGNRAVALVQLGRAYAEAGDRTGFAETIIDLKHALENVDDWTPGFHPIAVREVELRGRLTLSRPADMILEPESGLGSNGRLPAPQWGAICAITNAQASLQRGDVAQGVSELQNGALIAREQGLARQLERAERVLKPHAVLSPAGLELLRSIKESTASLPDLASEDL